MPTPYSVSTPAPPPPPLLPHVYFAPSPCCGDKVRPTDKASHWWNTNSPGQRREGGGEGSGPGLSHPNFFDRKANNKSLLALTPPPTPPYGKLAWHAWLSSFDFLARGVRTLVRRTGRTKGHLPSANNEKSRIVGGIVSWSGLAEVMAFLVHGLMTVRVAEICRPPTYSYDYKAPQAKYLDLGF